MTYSFNEPLFVFEMANNHMGSVDHGIHMIETFAKVKNKFPFQFAFKFQFRDLNSFIHPDFKSRMDLKYIKRFSETALTMDQFKKLKTVAEKNGFLTMCTPFDEASVDRIVELKFDILKIASCSFTDWPLLERVVKTNLPLIASTAAATLEQIDNVVSFLSHRDKKFALMHCTGEYPTKRDSLQLNQIDLLKNRYSGVPIGYSTHEEPANMESIKIAIGKGAMVFEKHVAVDTAEFKKNEYSATPEQIEQWLTAAQSAFEICGIKDQRHTSSQKELQDLRQFRRGMFASHPVRKGEKLDSSNTFLAFPNNEGQIIANDLSKYIDYVASENLEARAPVMHKATTHHDKREKIKGIVTKVNQLLLDSKTVVPGMAELEISHHYGLEKFQDVGCVLINVVNREYCKKLIVVMPNQKHPEQYHKQKEETFVVLHGDVTLTLDGVDRACRRGDVVTVNRGVKHAFCSSSGAIIEEISSTHFTNDSFYTDESISKNKDRKTSLAYWMVRE